MVRSQWKTPFVHYNLLKNIFANKKRSVIKTTSRSSVILQSFVGLIIQVYTGKRFNNVYINEKMVNHKLGEFSFTRKVGRIHDKSYKKWKKGKK